MTNRPEGAELMINYDPVFHLRIAFASMRDYAGIGLPEYLFEVEYHLCHPTGTLGYFGSDLCFDPKSFAQFSQELRAMQQGVSPEAGLKNVGEMMVLQLSGNPSAS